MIYVPCADWDFEVSVVDIKIEREKVLGEIVHKGWEFLVVKIIHILVIILFDLTMSTLITPINRTFIVSSGLSDRSRK